MSLWQRLTHNMRRMFSEKDPLYLTRLEGETSSELDTLGAIRALSEVVRPCAGREIFARIRASNMRAYLPRKSEMFLPKSW